MEPLTPGMQLGPYRVEGVLGAGGMGRVYRATDMRLRRPVAIKTSDERFGERFEREARTIAALTHPHICTLYDVGPDYLVMELIEGQTLAQRLARGPLPLDEALEIARQIAEALEAAHEKGIVHRDLKPANVALTGEGTVKVLDFGLAKATRRADEELPTMAADLTRGVLLGTSGYMSPEQIEGKSVDERADIWAFGVVLYEMLARRPPFGESGGSATLAEVLTRPVDYTPIPPKVQPLLRRCLARDPRRRLRAIGDARLWLEDTVTRESQGDAAAGPRLRRRVAAGALAIAALVVLAALYPWPRTAPPPAEPARMALDLPQGVEVTRGIGFDAGSLAFSPDGRMLVIAGTDEDGQQQLYARALDQFDAAPIPGTTGGSGPFFSPDGTSLGFFADGRLKRLSLSGGVAVDIAPVPGFPAGASWSPDGRIAFVAGAQSWLHVVSSGGGAVETLVPLEAGEGGHFRPQFLPDGRTLLFDSRRHVYAVDLTSGRRATLTEGIAPRYTATGHVIFARESALLIAPFDPERLVLTAPPEPLLDGIAAGAATSGVHFAISTDGHLAYLAGTSPLELVYRDAEGAERLITQPRPDFQNPRFSPDGRQLAVAVGQRPGQGVNATDLWIHDLDTGVATRLTFDRGRAPVWRPDGAAVTYSHLPDASSGERQGIYTKRVDGRGNAELLTAVDNFHWLVGWTPDGRTLAYGRMEGAAADGTTLSSIIALSDGHPRYVVEPGLVWGGRLSPDGQWLAYYVQDSGRFEVYVTPFPEGGERWLISDQGGMDPSWGPDGAELYYHFAGRLLAARVDKATGVRVVSRRLVLEPFSPPHFDDYHVHPDGEALVYVRPAARGHEVRVVLNWLTELGRLAER